MQVSKASLIVSFANGRFPTGEDFENLIDSCYNNGLSASTALVDTLSTNALNVSGYVGINTSIAVSLFPSGSAQLTFVDGVLVSVV